MLKWFLVVGVAAIGVLLAGSVMAAKTKVPHHGCNSDTHYYSCGTPNSCKGVCGKTAAKMWFCDETAERTQREESRMNYVDASRTITTNTDPTTPSKWAADKCSGTENDVEIQVY